METITQPEVVEDQTTQPEVEEVVEQTQQVETTESQPKLKVKYNKEEKEITLEEAKQYAEKGMNYDKINTRLETTQKEYEALKSSKGLSVLEQIAKSRGRTVEEIAESMERNMLAEKAKEQGKSVEEVKRDIERENEIAELKKFREIAESKDARQREVAEFSAKHPDLLKVPDEVAEAFQNGANLEVEYTRYEKDREIASLKKQLGIETANLENSEASTGALGNQGESHEVELTQKRIDAMSPAELEKNAQRIFDWATSGN